MAIIDKIILILLGIITIRQLIAQNFDIPLPNGFKWILYNKRDLQPPVLCRRIYDINQTFQDDRSSSEVIEELLALDSRHIKYYPEGIRHGRTTMIGSKYFINTLEASYCEKDLRIMSKALQGLIARSGLTTDVDFILFLKSGNQLLANSIYPEASNIIRVCRIDGGKEFHPLKVKTDPGDFSILYENLDQLLQVAEALPAGDKLTGIVVDCSVSSGKSIDKCIKSFNILIQEHNLAINPIQDAFVLYAHKPYVDKSDYTLHRYFDMNEEIRQMIYQMSTHNVAKSEKMIYRKLAKEKLIKDL